MDISSNDFLGHIFGPGGGGWTREGDVRGEGEGVWGLSGAGRKESLLLVGLTFGWDPAYKIQSDMI